MTLKVLTAGLIACLAFPVAAQTVERQIEQARVAAAAYTNLATVRATGWRPFGGDEPLMGQHWAQPNGVDYVSGMPIDPQRPSNLLFTEIAGQMQLVALSYNVRIAPGEAVPPGFTGGSDVWHVHDIAAFIAAAGADRPLLRQLASRWLERDVAGRDGKTRLAMVHLWLIPNPDGVFASHNRTLAYLDLGLPTEWAEGAGMDAARGLALAGNNGCAEALDGKLWVANVSRATARRLALGCAQMAAYVTDAIASNDRDDINARAAAGWRGFDKYLQDTLTPEQKRRIAAITEHGMDHGAMGHN